MRARVALCALLGLSRVALAQQQELPHSDMEAPAKPAPRLTKTPALTRFVQAAYPKGAEAAGLNGDVTFEIDIGADGKVTAARVVKPAGNGFDEAALAAVKQFEFSPAEIDEKPAAVTIGYVYHFVLAAPEPVPLDAGREVPRVHVSGTVLERATKKPLPGVQVAFDQGAELDTGAGGAFEVDLPAGPHALAVTGAGYQPLAKQIELKPGKSLALTLYLRPEIQGLFQTVVKAKAEKDVVEVYTLERDQVRRAPGTFGDPLHIIEDLPGVARTPFDLGFLIVNGANPLDTPVYYDGLQIPLLFHFGGGPAVVNAEFIDLLDFYPGGEGVRYGHGIGGAVDIESRALKVDHIRANADVNIAFAQAFLEVPLPIGDDDWVVAIAGRRSYFDFLLKPFLSGGTVVVPYFWDYQFKIQKGKAGDKNIFSLMAFGSNDTLQILSQNFASSQQALSIDYSTQFHRVVGRWDYKDGAFTSSVRPWAGIQTFNFAFGSSNGQTNEYNVGLRHDMSYELSPRHLLRFGEEVTYGWFTAGVTLPTIPSYAIFPGSSVQEPLQSLSRFYDGLQVGLWAEDSWKIRDDFTVTPGLRLEGYQDNASFFAAVEPRLAFKWSLTSKLALKGSVGLYHEAPPLQYFDPQFGNPNLQLLQAIQYLGGFEYTFPGIFEHLHLDAVGFYSDRSNLLSGFFAVSAPGQTPIQNIGIGRAYGLEIYLKHDITQRLFGWLSYTFSRTDFANAQNQAWQLGAYDETHILAAVASYVLGGGFTLGARFRYVTGTPITPIVGSTLHGDQDTYTPIYGATDSQRIGDYRQLDVRIDKEWAFERWKLDLYLDVWNALNFSNEEFRVYDYRSRAYAVLQGYPILPLLGIRGEY